MKISLTYRLTVTVYTFYNNLCLIVQVQTTPSEQGLTKTLIAKTTQLNDQDFIIRSIYKDSYWLHFKHIHHHFNRSFMYITVPPVNNSIYIIVHMVVLKNGGDGVRFRRGRKFCILIVDGRAAS